MTPRVKPRAGLTAFAAALANRDVAAAAGLFRDECFWRDLVAFTWNVKTLEGARPLRPCSPPISRRLRRRAGGSKARRPRARASSRPGSVSRREPPAAAASCDLCRQGLDPADGDGGTERLTRRARRGPRASRAPATASTAAARIGSSAKRRRGGARLRKTALLRHRRRRPGRHCARRRG